MARVVLVTTPNRPRDWYSFSDDGTALDWLGYASLPKLDYQSESLVNEIYRGKTVLSATG